MANEENPHVRDQFKAKDKTIPFKGEEAIDTDCLECFDYEYADKPAGDFEIAVGRSEGGTQNKDLKTIRHCRIG